MARIFKHKRRRPLPSGAEIVRKRNNGKIARWVAGNGKRKEAPLSDDGESIIIESGVYRAEWRDADGVVHQESTGCRDGDMAMAWLQSKVKDSERITSGIVTSSEAQTAEKAAASIDSTLQTFAADLESKGRTGKHTREILSVVSQAAAFCGWRQLHDLDGNSAEAWLQGRRRDDDISARQYNKCLTLLHAFGAYCLRRRLISANPFAGLGRLSTKTDRRYVRRTLTPSEVSAIVAAGKSRAREAVQGDNRAMAYMLMAYTGLRWNECRTLRLSDVHLEGETPYIELQAGLEKNRQGAKIPLHAQTAAALDSFIAQRIQRLTGALPRLSWNSKVVPFPSAEAPLFDALPKEISVIFQKDIKAAGVVSPDSYGKVVDVHCLRYFFASELARAGVPLHLVQKLMRHSTPVLTAQVYVHATLSDMGDAVNGLDAPSSEAASEAAAKGTGKSTGVDGITSHNTAHTGTKGNKTPVYGASGGDSVNPLESRVYDDSIDDMGEWWNGIHGGLKIRCRKA